MAKSKKSKILAMALCASVMTGIYASPVMAAGQISGITLADSSTTLVANDQIFINGVELSGDAVKATGGNFTQLTVTNGMGITGGVLTVGGTSIDSTTGNTSVGGTLTATKLASLNGGLNVSGGATVNGGLTVNDTATVNGMLTASDGLTVTNDGIKVEEGGLTVVQGTTDIQDGLTVSGGATVSEGLTVTGETTLAGLTAGATTVDSLKSNGNAEVGGTLAVTGDTTLAGLTAGATTVDSLKSNGNAEVGGTLAVTGDTTLAGLTAGATTVDSLTVNGAATVDSLEVAKGIEAANGKFQLTEAGVLTVNGEAAFTKGVTVQNGLSVTGGASVDGNFAVTNGGLSVSGGESVLNGGLTVNNGDTKLNGKLDVGAGNFKVDTAGNTEFNGNLKIGHDAFEVTAADGSFSAARDKFKVSADGVINADSLYLQTYGGGTLEVGEALQALTDAKLPDKVGGIERNPAEAGDPGNGTTTIESGAEFTKTAMTMGDTIVESGKITVGAEGDQTIIEGGAITTNTINAGGTIINNAGMTVGDTVVADSKITVGAEGDQTVIEGGAITAKSLVLGTKDVGATIAGIKRETVTDEFGTVNTTTIEGALKVSDNGLISNADGSFTVDSYGGLAAGGGTFAADMTGITMKAPVQMHLQGDSNYKGISVIDLGTTISDIDDRLDVLEYKTQNIKPGTGAGTGTGEGGTAVGEDNNIIDVPPTEDGHTGINGNVTVGGGINAGAGNIGGVDMEEGAITTGNTTINGNGIDTVNGDFSGEVNVGGNTNITGDGITTGSGEFTGNVTVGGDINAGTGNIGGIDMAGGTITTGDTTIDGDGITADTGDIGGIGMAGGTITTGDTTIDGNGMTVGKGTDITDIKDGNITVKGDEGKVEIGKGDVAIFDENGEKVTSIQHNYDEINRVEEKFDGEVNRLDNRITKVEDRIDKVGAMSAAIANLRTMGYDPAAPTEIAVGVGQYRSETGVALGMFHYPNKDFMLSLSVSTSGDEVMGGIGATWKFGRKSPEKVLAAEKEKAAKAKLAKAEAMKKAAKEAKIKAQQERHAKLAAERAAQAEAAK